MKTLIPVILLGFFLLNACANPVAGERPDSSGLPVGAASEPASAADPAPLPPPGASESATNFPAAPGASVVVPGPADTLEEFLPGESPVSPQIAQPDLPQALRPAGIPVPRPRAGSQEHSRDATLIETLPQPLRAEKPYQPKPLLPEPAADPGVVYVVPFSTIMVPRQVESRLFDQFIERLNARGPELGLYFVILKEGLDRVEPQWLAKRKYVTGEIYAYVEEFGSLTTDLRTRVRMVYYRANQDDPAFVFEYPTRIFFDRDRSTLEAERLKLADQVARVLAEELLTALIL